VVFDEASSWWSSQVVLLQNSREIKEQVQKKTKVQQQDLGRVDNVEPSSEQVR
jgi:hypothetical protein